MGNKKFFLIAALAVALGAFAFFIVSNTDRNGLMGQRLPDGSTFRLGKVVFTNGGFSYGAKGTRGLAAMLVRILPSRLSSKFGLGASGTISFGPMGTGTNLCIFTVHEGQSNSKFNNLRFIISDEMGNFYDAGYPRGVMVTSDPMNELRVEGWCPEAFPRRGKELRLRFYEKGRTNAPLLAELMIPNPARSTYPNWTPEMLPTTRTNGDLFVSLISLKSGLSVANASRVAFSNEASITLAGFRVVQEGRETNSWRPLGVEIWDATGNHWSPYPNTTSTRRENGLDYYKFDGLWPGEDAWKMRFEFSRVADYQPDEVFTFNGIIVPGATQVIPLENSTNIGGSEVRLKAISGEMAEQPGNLKWSTVKKRSNISVSVTPLPEDCRLALLKVTDESGREAEIKHQPNWNQPERVFAFKVREGAKQLNFTFALHKSRFVEFMAKPEFARNSALPPR